MNATRALLSFLLLYIVAGCAVSPAVPKPESLALPITERIVVSVCYFKKPNYLLSKSEPVSKGDFSEFIQKEMTTFIAVLGRELSEAGFSEVSVIEPVAGHCDIVDDSSGGIGTGVMFVASRQGFGGSEDMITADTFIKMPNVGFVVKLVRKTINGGITNVRAAPAAEEVAAVLLKRIREAQQNAKSAKSLPGS